MARRTILIFILLLLATSSFAEMPLMPESPEAPEAKEPFNQPGPIMLTKDGERWAAKTLKKMSVEEKVGQLIMVRAFAEFQSDENSAYTGLRDQIRRFHIGSVIITVRTDGALLLRSQPYEAAIAINRLQRDSELPLLVAADFERGTSMRLASTPLFPHAMAFGAAGKPEYVEAFAKVTARESRTIGVHWNFFPVADVNSNPQNPIINARSFGEAPEKVGELVAAYIRGAHENGMLATAKHFPGHGDTDTDSHLGLARVGGSLEHLKNIELPPFQSAIAAGVDAVMLAHVTVPALEPDPNRVATTSSKVVNDLLIHEMGFKGLVVTDAMEMGALTRIYQNQETHSAVGHAAVDAFIAGNDIILLPSDLEGAYTGLVDAVNRGEISGKELDRRVLKVLETKASLGLHRGRLVDIDEIPRKLGLSADMAMAQQIADSAVTLVRDHGRPLDLLAAIKQPALGTSGGKSAYRNAGPPEVVALVLTDDARADSGRVFERELRARAPNAAVIFIDPSTARLQTEPVTTAVLDAKVVIIAAYAVPTSGKARRVNGELKNTVSLPEDTAALVERTLKIAATKIVMVALGNPYLAGDFPQVLTYICTFSNAPTSETAAVKALFGEIGFAGRLPVTLPGVGKRGEGLEHTVAAPSPASSSKEDGAKQLSR